MDDLTNRILAVAFALLWIFGVLVIILLVWSSPDESITRISDLAGYLDDHNTTEAKLIITFGGIILILLATLLILFELVPAESNNLKIQQVGGGNVEISADEAVVSRVIDGEIDSVGRPDALVVVADACSLERSLLLVGQVLRHGLPTCLVLSMIDELRARGGSLDRGRLEAALGIPVVEVVGHRGLGLGRRRALLAAPEGWTRPPIPPRPGGVAPSYG